MRGTGESLCVNLYLSRLRPVREHVPYDMVVDADERLHDWIGRRRVAALREREQVEQILQRQAEVLLVGPGGDDALDEAPRRDVMLVVGQVGLPRYGVVERPGRVIKGVVHARIRASSEQELDEREALFRRNERCLLASLLTQPCETFIQSGSNHI
jgi:hypothetical protein